MGLDNTNIFKGGLRCCGMLQSKKFFVKNVFVLCLQPSLTLAATPPDIQPQAFIVEENSPCIIGIIGDFVSDDHIRDESPP